jgi:hypothetical protein
MITTDFYYCRVWDWEGLYLCAHICIHDMEGTTLPYSTIRKQDYSFSSCYISCYIKLLLLSKSQSYSKLFTCSLHRAFAVKSYGKEFVGFSMFVCLRHVITWDSRNWFARNSTRGSFRNIVEKLQQPGFKNLIVLEKRLVLDFKLSPCFECRV